MGHLDESNQTYEDLESENATKNNINEASEHPSINHDESISFGSNKELISRTSDSSSMLSDFSPEDLQIIDSEDDENNNENLSGSKSETIPPKISTGPGNWSMASHESLFSIHMGGTSFCRLDSVNTVCNLPQDSQFVDGKILEMDEEDIGNDFSTFASSRSNSSSSFVFPFVLGETEKDGSPYPRGSLKAPVPQSPPKLELELEPRSEPTTSDARTEEKETTTFWTEWFPCFRFCACCS